MFSQILENPVLKNPGIPEFGKIPSRKILGFKFLIPLGPAYEDGAWVTFPLQMASTTNWTMQHQHLLHSSPCSAAGQYQPLPASPSPLPPLSIFHPDIQGKAGSKAKLLTTGGWHQKNLDKFDPFVKTWHQSFSPCPQCTLQDNQFW